MELRLTADDYNLLLKVVSLSPAPEVALRAGMVEGMFLRFDMPVEVGGELLVDMMNAALACGSRRQRVTLERLIRKVTEELIDEGLAFDEDPLGLVQRGSVYNTAPQSDLGGLSPQQVRHLLDNEWDSDSPGVQMRLDVPLDLLATSDTLHNAQTLLRALAENGARATPAGNLNRAFVQTLLNQMRLPSGYVDDLRKYHKVINEQDAWLLHELRLVLELGELIELRTGSYRLTNRGRELLVPDRAGALLATLFETTFRIFNLGFHDRLPDADMFQATISYPLAVLAQQPAGWLDYRDLVPRLMLPALSEMLPRLDYLDLPDALVSIRLLDRLERFGLVEIRHEETEALSLRRIAQVRRAPLWDHFLRIALD